MKYTLLAFLSVASIVHADLGETRAQIDLKYVRLAHDGSFDVMGADGKPHELPGFYTIYRQGDWVIDLHFNQQGIVTAAGYGVGEHAHRSSRLTDADLRALLTRNQIDPGVIKRAKFTDYLDGHPFGDNQPLDSKHFIRVSWSCGVNGEPYHATNDVPTDVMISIPDALEEFKAFNEKDTEFIKSINGGKMPTPPS
jgi:hypothetical protein